MAVSRGFVGGSACSGCGLLLMILGILLSQVIIPNALKSSIREAVKLKYYDEEQIADWKNGYEEDDIPMYYYHYLWNITNPDLMSQSGFPPKLEEVGPFVYQRFSNKSEVVFFDDGAQVEYNSLNAYVYRPDLSCDLSLDTPILTFEYPYHAAATKYGEDGLGAMIGATIIDKTMSTMRPLSSEFAFYNGVSLVAAQFGANSMLDPSYCGKFVSGTTGELSEDLSVDAATAASVCGSLVDQHLLGNYTSFVLYTDMGMAPLAQTFKTLLMSEIGVNEAQLSIITTWFRAASISKSVSSTGFAETDFHLHLWVNKGYEDVLSVFNVPTYYLWSHFISGPSSLTSAQVSSVFNSFFNLNGASAPKAAFASFLTKTSAEMVGQLTTDFSLTMDQSLTFLSYISSLVSPDHLCTTCAAATYMKANRVELFVTHTVRELMDGYAIAPLGVTFETTGQKVNRTRKVGWRTAEEREAQGFKMYTYYTGVGDINDVWRVSKLNGKSYSDGQGTGKIDLTTMYDGGQYPPDLSRDYVFKMLEGVLERKLFFYEDPVNSSAVIEGLEAMKVVLNNSVLAPMDENPENALFNQYYQGCINMTAIFGIPAVFSMPHLHLVDRKFQDNVLGMHPDPKKHEVVMYANLQFGSVIGGKKPIQMNYVLSPLNVNYPKLPTDTLLPLWWYSYGGDITPKTAGDIKDALDKVDLFKNLSLYLGVIGGCICAAVGITFIYLSQQPKTSTKVALFNEMNPVKKEKGQSDERPLVPAPGKQGNQLSTVDSGLYPPLPNLPDNAKQDPKYRTPKEY
eukprot:GCRY01001106.1.p1 GENE.GCRY01001106.1~~GCRY01001106.1.p1  ORF type:complete len:794 (-),score=129.99 GCRY01001106.1:555-2936(-)